MLYLYRNNRLESLLLDLASVLIQPKRRVLSPELIVVQSLGMERWLAMGLANQFSAWANATYPFPRAFIDTLADSVLGPQTAGERYSRENMALQLAVQLSSIPSEPRLKPLSDYLDQRPGVVGRLELSEHLAEALDQVQVYRPDWLTAWAKDNAEDKHVELLPAVYRLLASRMGEQHVPARAQLLIERLEGGKIPPELLPERIILFGVASLPPMFIRVFDALSRHLPVHWFLLTASREYIGEESGKRQALSSQLRAAQLGSVAPEAELASPQPLLMHFGRIMRDMGLLLERDCHYVDGVGVDFVEPNASTVLATLQADLCALRRRGQVSSAPRLRLLESDRSLEIHACHGPRRELEVLRELLVDSFERDPSLRPEDVIVLLRDVETYAPLVEAVFSAEPGQGGYVPYTLSDRTVGASHPFAESMVKLLELATARITVADLSHLLGHAPILARFGIEPAQLPKLRDWLRRLNVTWGVDLSDRAREGLAGQRENTLRFGLSRLLLGAACDSGAGVPWKGILPIDVEGEEAELAGRLVECAEAVFTWRDRFAAPHSFGDWYRVITLAAQALLSVEANTAWQLADLLQFVGSLKELAEGAGFEEAVPAHTVAAKIRQHFDQTRTSQTLLSSGVTFCRMLPMRGIPARIIAMVGLDDGCFPRTQAHSTFDAVARSPGRPGDRVTRDEDRHLFLETLLAARERLIITYRGRDARADALLPRSVVVEELLSVVDESFECASGK
ncbi:MAG TPA: exodeoxyribonuclease V subunit gamma, partial [Polyangiaceae bacterium]|nr:exodeoxyribonuclease V subunit gamma [Polyangiaceae bacterium]